MISITRPTSMKLQDWTDRVVLDLDPFGPFEKMKGLDWQAWGVQLLNSASLGSFNIPNPYQFVDWKLWAEYLCGDLA